MGCRLIPLTRLNALALHFAIVIRPVDDHLLKFLKSLFSLPPFPWSPAAPLLLRNPGRQF